LSIRVQGGEPRRHFRQNFLDPLYDLAYRLVVAAVESDSAK
jgi:hypothetical protein